MQRGQLSMSHPSLSVADVMRQYNVSRTTIYRRSNDGTLKAYKLGTRLIRFDAAEVAAAFIAAPAPHPRPSQGDAAEVAAGTRD